VTSWVVTRAKVHEALEVQPALLSLAKAIIKIFTQKNHRNRSGNTAVKVMESCSDCRKTRSSTLTESKCAAYYWGKISISHKAVKIHITLLAAEEIV